MIEWLIIGGFIYFLGKGIFNESETEKLKREINTLQTTLDKTTLILAGHEARINRLEHLTLDQKMRIHQHRIMLLDYRCKKYGRPTVLRLNYRNSNSWNYGNFFLGCSGFPYNCKEAEPLPQFIEQRLINEMKLIEIKS